MLSFALVVFSVHASAEAASPTLKVQLQSLIQKVASSWPKIGSYGIGGEGYLNTQILFYNGQLEYRMQRQSSGGSFYWDEEVFEPMFSYLPFNNNGASAKYQLDKAGMKRADWVRYTGGYSGNDFSDWSLTNPRHNYVKNLKSYEKLFNDPVNIVKNAVTKSKSISQNKKSKQWMITGTCQVQVLNIPENFTNAERDITTITVTRKCTTYVDFNTNGTLKFIQQYSEVEGNVVNFVFNTPKPVAPFVDHAYVMDGETGILAEYP
jgi:hypothetical protein